MRVAGSARWGCAVTRGERAALALAEQAADAVQRRVANARVLVHGPRLELVHRLGGRVHARCYERRPEHTIGGAPLHAHRAYLLVRVPWLHWAGRSRFDVRRWWRRGRFQPCWGVIAGVMEEEASIMRMAGCDGLPPPTRAVRR